MIVLILGFISLLCKSHIKKLIWLLLFFYQYPNLKINFAHLNLQTHQIMKRIITFSIFILYLLVSSQTQFEHAVKSIHLISPKIYLGRDC